MTNRPEEMDCPACGQRIDCETCYELVMCLSGQFKLGSVPEVKITDAKKAREICDRCPYSDLE